MKRLILKMILAFLLVASAAHAVTIKGAIISDGVAIGGGTVTVQYRITEDGDKRITEDGDYRII